MTSDPIRFLDDPSAAIELREFMLGQARPDRLSEGKRQLIHGRIAASALALPVSMKLGGLISQGSSTVGGSVTSSTAAGSGAASGAAAASGTAGTTVAGSAMTSSAAAAVSAKAGMGVAATGFGAVSVAPAAMGGAVAGTSLTLAGAKTVAAGVAGALSLTKGAAVLGVALATGAGATYVAQEGLPARASSSALLQQLGVDDEEADARRLGAQTVRARSLRAGSGEVRPGEVRQGRSVEADETPIEASADALKARCAGGGVCAPAGAASVAGGGARSEQASQRRGALSLEDLADVQDGRGGPLARVGAPSNSASSSCASSSCASGGNLDSSRTASGVAPSGGAVPNGLGDAADSRSDTALSSQSQASERLQEEVELLRRAQQLLRTDRTLAAEALERYDAKFPDGVMRAEYDVLRRRLVGSSRP